MHLRARMKYVVDKIKGTPLTNFVYLPPLEFVDPTVFCCIENPRDTFNSDISECLLWSLCLLKGVTVSC